MNTYSAQPADAAFLPSSGVFAYLPFDKLDPSCGIIHIGEASFPVLPKREKFFHLYRYKNSGKLSPKMQKFTKK